MTAITMRTMEELNCASFVLYLQSASCTSDLWADNIITVCNSTFWVYRMCQQWVYYVCVCVCVSQRDRFTAWTLTILWIVFHTIYNNMRNRASVCDTVICRYMALFRTAPDWKLYVENHMETSPALRLSYKYVHDRFTVYKCMITVCKLYGWRGSGAIGMIII